VTARGKLKNRTDEPADDHRPTGQAEELIATLPGEQQEGQAERKRDAVVREAAEDTHQEHEAVGTLEILATDALVLREKERYDALRPQLQQRLLVALEEDTGPRSKKQDEDGRQHHARNRAVRAQEMSHQPHQQREHSSSGRDDNERVPDEAACLGDDDQRQTDIEEYD